MTDTQPMVAACERLRATLTQGFPTVYKLGGVEAYKADLSLLLSAVQPLAAPLTARQADVLRFIRGTIDERNHAPTLQTIADQFGYRSLATVHEHLVHLEEKGYIRRSANRVNGIALVAGAP